MKEVHEVNLNEKELNDLRRFALGQLGSWRAVEFSFHLNSTHTKNDVIADRLSHFPLNDLPDLPRVYLTPESGDNTTGAAAEPDLSPIIKCNCLIGDDNRCWGDCLQSNIPGFINEQCKDLSVAAGIPGAQMSFTAKCKYMTGGRYSPVSNFTYQLLKDKTYQVYITHNGTTTFQRIQDEFKQYQATQQPTGRGASKGKGKRREERKR